MKIIPGLLYSEEHEWVKVDGDIAYIGITDFAQHQLGDIVFVELPVLDDELGQGDVLAVVESVKAASDVYCPLSGKVVQVNGDLLDNPGQINEDPYGAWIAAIAMSDKAQLDSLLDDAAYEPLCRD